MCQLARNGSFRILNVQDDCNVAIGLGVLVASKRHPNFNERTLQGKDLHHQLSGPRQMQKRINEAERFGRWARIAAAFPAGQGTYLSSDRELVDRCVFTEWDTWAGQTHGKMVRQSAPAVMARNMPLPVVDSDGPAPFVCATTYPNGPTGIAAEGRVSPEKRWFEPRARVTVQIKDASQPIGIAGHYRELVLQFAGSIQKVQHIWAQDLLAEQAVDLMGKVSIDGNQLAIPGKLIDEIGTSVGDEGDLSAPGMVLQLSGKSLPVAGSDFAPKTTPVAAAPPPTTQEKGFLGAASLSRVDYGYRVRSSEGAQFVVKKLPQSIKSGNAVISWKMKPANSSSAKKNGFLVLSSDAGALASVLAGSWIGAKQMSIFENTSNWGRGPSRPCKTGEELACRLVLDMDARKATLTVNGTNFKQTFSESVTSIHYIGFGVLDAETLFSEPEIRKD